MCSSATSPAGSSRPAELASGVAATLCVSSPAAEAIVVAFERFVAEPLEQNLERVNAHTLAKRNPMIYTARGATTIDQWVDRDLEDRETSAIEGHLGTWQERWLVSFARHQTRKQRRSPARRSGVVELYAIQSARNTKSSGGRRSDVDALRRAAGAIRASRRRVDPYIAVLSGRRVSRALRPIRMSSSSPRMSSGSARAVFPTFEPG